MIPRILVVDDEESIRLSFQLFLSREGHEVILAENYSEAVRIMSQESLDLVFADIILGGSRGTDILREARQRGLRCPVVMITGQPDLESAAEAVRQGAFDYLPKPVRKETLLRISRIALEQKRLHDENARMEMERENHRQHLEAVFRSLHEGIVTVDREMRVTHVNAAAEALLEHSPQGIVGRSPGKKGAESLEPVARFLRDAVSGGINARECRVQFRTAAGSRRVLVVNCTTLFDHLQQSIGAVLTLRDITRLEDLERQLADRHRFHNLVGKSTAMQEVYRLIETLAETDTTVLIMGESGTGKELAARALHYEGRRARQPFVTANCTALADSLLESELFGHVKGAFTGAWTNKRGYFESADGGTIFLDEIGDISPLLQVKLLRVIQEREIERVGDSRRIGVDVRVLAATHRNLREKVRQGLFREDLYYRLKVVEIQLPPLRSRTEDIPLLVDHFRVRFNERFDKSIQGIHDEVLERFMLYPWPGNVRELQHAMEHAFVMCPGGLISVRHLPSEIREASPSLPGLVREDPMERCDDLRKALEISGGNKAKAARLLGISRQTLYRRLQERQGEDFHPTTTDVTLV